MYFEATDCGAAEKDRPDKHHTLSGGAEEVVFADSSRDFGAGQSLKPKEYFVYFEAANCGTVPKDRTKT